MKTDLELLTLAAKAIGLVGDCQTKYMLQDGDWNDITAFFLADDAGWWNPLTDDGDAFRLAVKLRIDVEPWIHGDSACARAAVGEVLIDEPHYGDDPGRATRHAIVRAAAQIGEAMP